MQRTESTFLIFTSREAARSCRGVFSLVGKKTIGLLKNDKFPFDDSSCWEEDNWFL